MAVEEEAMRVMFRLVLEFWVLRILMVFTGELSLTLLAYVT